MKEQSFDEHFDQLVEQMIVEDVDELEASPAWEFMKIKVGMAMRQYEEAYKNPALPVNVRLDAIGRIEGIKEFEKELDGLRAMLLEKAEREKALRENKNSGMIDPLVEALQNS